MNPRPGPGLLGLQPGWQFKLPVVLHHSGPTVPTAMVVPSRVMVMNWPKCQVLAAALQARARRMTVGLVMRRLGPAVVWVALV